MFDSFKQFWQLLTRYNRRSASAIMLGVSLAIITQFCSLATPFLTKILIDDVIGARNYALLTWFLFFCFAVLIVLFVTSLGSNYILSRTFKRNGVQLRMDLLDALLRAPLAFYGRTTSGEMVYRLYQDTEVVEDSWSSILITLPYQSVLLASGAIMLLWQRELALFVFLLLGLQAYIVSKFHSPLLRLANRRKQAEQERDGYTVERLSKIQLVRTLGGERKERRAIHSKLHQLILVAIREFMLSRLGGATVTAVSNLWVFGILWYGGRQVIAGAMSLGELMAFVQLANLLYQPVSTMVSLILKFQGIRASIARIDEYSRFKPDVADRLNVRNYTPARGSLSLNDVSFGYNSRPILKGVCLQVEPNTILALVGRTGSGKTTLCRLIARLLDHSQGTILVDGVDVRNYSASSVRRAILLMIQGDFLVNGTLWQNLTYGVGEVSADQVLKVLSATELSCINELPERADTLVGQGGLNVSGGEAQRIALARAMLFKPAVLILDEPTSNVDPITERSIRTALLKLREQCTIILVAHQLSTLEIADRIAVLEDGRITAQGDAKTLVDTALVSSIFNVEPKKRD